jgi:phosphatidylglycerol:prolipoprotein diacylglycerol transferase
MYLTVSIYGYSRLLQLPNPPEIVGRAMLITILAIFFGSIFPSALNSIYEFVKTGYWHWNAEVRLLWGMSFGIGAAWIYIRRVKLPLGRTFDLGGLPFPLGMAIGRLGCLSAGCCYGIKTQSWLGMYLPDISGEWTIRYPTQLMSAVGNLSIFFILILVEQRGFHRSKGKPGWLFDGFLFLLFISLYCLKRFWIQFLRYDHAPILGFLDTTQIITLIGFLTGLALIIYNIFLQRHTHA